MIARVLHSQVAQRTAAFLLGAYLRFALATTRWTLDGEAHIAPFLPAGPVVVAFWHECLPLMPALWMHVRRQNRTRHARVLVSRHRDGRFIGAIMSHFHIGTVFGSATEIAGKPAKQRGGPASIRALLAALAAGDAVVLTPDGPRGPPRRAAPGAAHLASTSGAPLLPVAARVRRPIRLNSWDRIIVPLPWGRGVLVCLPPIRLRDAGPGAVATIEAALTAAAERAELLCPTTVL